ncbi:MAG: hypothetical protein HON76_05825 [Candidatus Scalindua sp.]|jgi:hypothetical protein|nr:hypothetical protein [Candidatus Scalindua sp.]MBT5307373.1 hypothetical protein [Candidatus Scalindua sp.]MBT6048601.1 hypothetical protein [Candidatus Scalindua sp.]MBT6226396.1 hypothetical protein [Candidatus Scalindua sp.]MBT6562029.1 hypothetical protein [Candidatus Scalindua sp.]
MQKKSVLGTDPFKWLKESNKEENTDNQKGDLDGQEKQAEKPLDPVDDIKDTGVEQEEKIYEPIDVSETLKLQGNKVHGLDNVTESYSVQEEETFESSDITEENRKAVLGKGAYAYHAKSRDTTQKDSPATAFVIVYTVLLLILGFIVYRDLTKQIDKLETKLEIVEKQLDAGLINYEDTEVNDVW